MDHSNSSNGDGASSEDFWNAAQQIMAAGEEAARLLNSPIFNLAYRQQMEDTINQWLVSEPKETNKRDSLYYQARAQVAMAERMQGFIEQAQRLAAEQAERQSPEAKHNQYLDTQGFGVQ